MYLDMWVVINTNHQSSFSLYNQNAGSYWVTQTPKLYIKILRDLVSTVDYS